MSNKMIIFLTLVIPESILSLKRCEKILSYDLNIFI